MKQPDGPINLLNLVIMGQVFFQMGGLLLAPLIATSLTVVALVTAWGYCTDTDFTPLMRAGTIISGIAFGYVVAEEAWISLRTYKAKSKLTFSGGMPMLTQRQRQHFDAIESSQTGPYAFTGQWCVSSKRH